MSGLRLPLLVLFILLLGCIFTSSAFLLKNPVGGLARCHPHHIQALVQFKNEFDSSSCNQTDYFNGVWCDNTTGVITKLQLPSGCLSGTLNPNSSLFQLHHLRYLNLSYNNFSSSSLPAGFGSLNKLEVLSLSSNGFIGQLPSAFSNLSKLSYLDLSLNKLTGCFPLVWNLSKLSCLDLSNNHLFGDLNPKSSLFELRHLLYLNLAYNNLSSYIPYEFGNLNRLEVLSLYSNGFKGQVPSSFSNLSQLTELYLSENELTGSIPLVQNLTKLSVLKLPHNHFSGAIPSSLFTMPFLSILNLAGNHLTDPVEVPSSSTPSRLKTLLLQNNLFEGKILELISNSTSLKSLVELDLSGNSISPTSLSSYSDVPLNIERLGLSGCNMREFPNFLKSLHSMEFINLSNNKIKGKVPEWFWNLPRLNTVYLLYNHFTSLEGSPEVLVNSSVRFLDIGFNHFKGPFPHPPLSIKLLSAWNNSFTGNIPLSVCNRSSLIVFDLSYNNLTGPIPRCLSNLKDSLTVVNLRKNNLEGSLPDMFHDSVLLRTLDVGYNQLTGKLPRSLMNCSSLSFISLDHNRMKDTFPFWLNALPALQALTLRSNKFYGSISPPGQDSLAFPNLRILEVSNNSFTGSLPPNYFVDWKASSLKINDDERIYMGDYHNPNYMYEDTLDLQYKGLYMEQGKILTSYATIDFSGNRLEGQIPESIGLLKALIALNLSNNAFTGHIPLSLENVTELESLDLSNNQLSGTIPKGLGSLSFLSYISVSHNQLNGEIPQGTQIVGQAKSSFEGNIGLCGLPLEENCFSDKRSPTQQQLKQEDEVVEEEEVLNWRAVAIGYGPGLVLGLSIGQVIASYKPEWLVKIGLYNCKNR